MEKHLQTAKSLFFEYGPNILYALGLLIVGLFVIKKIVGFTKKSHDFSEGKYNSIELSH